MTFQDLIADMTREYIAEKGNITCEFSTSLEGIEAKTKAIRARDDALAPLNARWVVYKCGTCSDYNKDCPYHVSIETYSFMPHDPADQDVISDKAPR